MYYVQNPTWAFSLLIFSSWIISVCEKKTMLVSASDSLSWVRLKPDSIELCRWMFESMVAEKTVFSINSNGSETDQWRLVLVLIPWNIEIFVRFTDDSGIQIIRNIWDGICVTYDIVVLHTFSKSTHCRRMMNTKLFYYNGFCRTNEKHDTLWMKIIQTLD